MCVCVCVCVCVNCISNRRDGWESASQPLSVPRKGIRQRVDPSDRVSAVGKRYQAVLVPRKDRCRVPVSIHNPQEECHQALRLQKCHEKSTPRGERTFWRGACLSAKWCQETIPFFTDRRGSRASLCLTTQKGVVASVQSQKG